MGTFEGGDVASGQNHRQPFRQQLARRFEPQTTVRAGDERDTRFAVPHPAILAAGAGCARPVESVPTRQAGA